MIIIFLIVTVCLSIVSAAIPATNHYSFRPTITQLSVIKAIPDPIENSKMIPDLSDKKVPNSYGGIQKLNPTSISYAAIIPGISRPSIIFSRMTNTDSGGYISKDEAIEIASTLFPGICLIKPMNAYFTRIDAPAYPLAKNPCWVVDIVGYNPEGDPCCQESSCIEGNVIKAYFPYGGHIIIDAVTGKTLYVDFLQ